MKIAFFVHGYLPWDAYGVPRYVERLSKYLAKRGHEIYIIVVGRSNLPKCEAPAPNIKVYRTAYFDLRLKRLTPFWSFASYTVGSIVEASRLVNKEGIQVIHGHTIQWGGLQSALVSKITHKPLIITLHGSGIANYPEKHLPQRLSFLRWANIIICQKMSAVKKLALWGIPEKKVVLLSQGCVDTKRFKPAKKKLQKDTSVVTFVGRLISFKGPHFLLEAAPHVLSKHPNTIFQFIGEGESKEYLLRKAKSMHIEDNVKFLGFRTDVNKLLINSDVFVSLSQYENVSDLALLEAMATGVPVVATDVGETSMIIRDGITGLLAKCDPKDIAKKIVMVLDDKWLAQALSRNERQLIVKEHCLDVSGKREEDIYRKLIYVEK